MLVVAMPKRQKTMSRTIAIGLSVPIYENIDEPKNIYILMVWQKLPENEKLPPYKKLLSRQAG